MKNHLRPIFVYLILVLAVPSLSGCFGGVQVTPDLTLTALLRPPRGTRPSLPHGRPRELRQLPLQRPPSLQPQPVKQVRVLQPQR
jgi:hypothetical protein